jgi:hypothetical protein
MRRSFAGEAKRCAGTAAIPPVRGPPELDAMAGVSDQAGEELCRIANGGST